MIPWASLHNFFDSICQSLKWRSFEGDVWWGTVSFGSFANNSLNIWILWDSVGVLLSHHLVLHITISISDHLLVSQMPTFPPPDIDCRPSTASQQLSTARPRLRPPVSLLLLAASIAVAPTEGDGSMCERQGKTWETTYWTQSGFYGNTDSTSTRVI